MHISTNFNVLWTPGATKLGRINAAICILLVVEGGLGHTLCGRAWLGHHVAPPGGVGGVGGGHDHQRFAILLKTPSQYELERGRRKKDA